MSYLHKKYDFICGRKNQFAAMLYIAGGEVNPRAESNNKYDDN